MVVGGNGCWGKKLKLRVWGKNEKEGKRGNGKRRKDMGELLFFINVCTHTYVY